MNTTFATKLQVYYLQGRKAKTVYISPTLLTANYSFCSNRDILDAEIKYVSCPHIGLSEFHQVRHQ